MSIEQQWQVVEQQLTAMQDALVAGELENFTELEMVYSQTLVKFFKQFSHEAIATAGLADRIEQLSVNHQHLVNLCQQALVETKSQVKQFLTNQKAQKAYQQISG